MQRAIALLVTLIVGCSSAADGSSPHLGRVQTIPLPNVEGRIDHFAADVSGDRVFVAALGNDTVEVIHLQAGKTGKVDTIRQLKNPQGVGYVPGLNRLVIANDTDGSVRIFDAAADKQLLLIDLKDDADNVRNDVEPGRVWVGYGSGALALIDVATGRVLKTVPLAGHPESFQIEQHGSRIFVNVPTAQQIAVVDRTTGKVIETWKLKDKQNFPMALDEANHRLLVATREEPKLLVFDTQTGRQTASLDIVGDADDVWLDPPTQRVFITGGEGFISVIEQTAPDRYRSLEKIPTAPGARTSLFVPQWHKLFVAVPHRGEQRAEVRVFEVIRF